MDRNVELLCHLQSHFIFKVVYKGSPSHGFSSNYVYQPHQTCTDALSHTFHTCLMLTAGLIADLHFSYSKCETCGSKKHTHINAPRLPARALCLACRGSTHQTHYYPYQ
ncbi:hypothetical protein BLNAU_25153 [Blattamonas nauphoetae]|uniref:Uncharacterized protein n=1 Tax=Blattamonas nauphoetae TaxID=2049346 RepID=A0ABQ9WKE4_9EUKA|nr:hypothetical protein BLNAU_25153 [Blattamonas nauphoetae]